VPRFRSPVSSQRLERWERRTATPSILAALVFLAAYAWPILQPDLPGWASQACSATTWTVWAAFGVDLLVRLELAEDRWAFLKQNWLDVITLLLPMLRPLRPLRAVVALNVLGHHGRVFARGRVVTYVGTAVAAVGFVAAVAVLDAERANPEANIATFGDALWWAATTVTTVGYGDRFPTTAEGRCVAVGLMLTGIALVGVVTAALASWFVERVSEVQAAERRTEQEVSDLTAEVLALRREIAVERDRSPQEVR
jgi:voltage-gated potassium channel